MAYNTMLRQLISKWGVMSIDLQTALNKDAAVTYGDGSVEYVDNSADYAPGTYHDPSAASLDAPRDDFAVDDNRDAYPTANDTGAGQSGDNGKQVSMSDL